MLGAAVVVLFLCSRLRVRELRCPFFLDGAVQALSTTVLSALVALALGLPVKNAPSIS